MVHLPLAACSRFVSSAETLVKLGFGTDAGASDDEVVRERVGSTKGDGVCHFYAFQDGRFVQVKPVALEVEVGSTEGSVQVVEKIIVMDGHGFVLPLVEASDAEVCALLDLCVFVILVPNMDGIIVEFPGGVEMIPDLGDSASGPRLTIAFVRASVVAGEM